MYLMVPTGNTGGLQNICPNSGERKGDKMTDKGTCEKHGEFILAEGCPQCLAERRRASIRPAQDEMENGLNSEGLTLAGAEQEPPAEAYHCPPDCRFSIPSGGSPDNPEIGGCAVVDKLPLAFEYDNDPSLPLCPEYQALAAAESEPAPGTAIVKVRPQADQAVIALHEQSLKLEQYAKALVITSDGDVKSATNDLSIISGLKKAIEEKRKEYIQPINDHLKAVNEAFKTFTEPLKQADQITRHKILDYRAEQERRRQEAEKIARLEQEAAERKAALTGEPIVVPEVEGTAPSAPSHYRAEMGTLGKIMVRKWEVEDMALVPEEYKMLDSARLTKVVKAGIPSIPGIRIWEEETLRVNTRKED